MKVLLVDDSPLSVKLFQTWVSTLPVEVHSLSAFPRHPEEFTNYIGVFLDIGLGDTDREEVLRRSVEFPCHVCFLTSSMDDNEASLAAKLTKGRGFHFISKSTTDLQVRFALQWMVGLSEK